MLPLGLPLDKQGGAGETGTGKVIRSGTVMEMATEPLASVFPTRMCGTFCAAETFE